MSAGQYDVSAVPGEHLRASLFISASTRVSSCQSASLLHWRHIWCIYSIVWRTLFHLFILHIASEIHTMCLLALFTIPHTQHSREQWNPGHWSAGSGSAQMLAQPQSDNWQAALADCKNPIRHKTCNPARGGFCRRVEIQPDPDTGLDIHPSLVKSWPSVSGCSIRRAQGPAMCD